MVNLVEYLCDLIITMVYIESISTGFYDMAQMDKVANIRDCIEDRRFKNGRLNYF